MGVTLRVNVNKFLIVIFTIFISSCSVLAYEDYIITTKGQLTDISIENNKIVNIYPLVTVMNNKNTLIVTPLQIGSTRFCILKNGKQKVMFHINITENETHIDEVKGFDILSFDTPPNYIKLDAPPLLREEKK